MEGRKEGGERRRKKGRKERRKEEGRRGGGREKGKEGQLIKRSEKMLFQSGLSKETKPIASLVKHQISLRNLFQAVHPTN